jgi:hypothetical protein
MCSVTDGEGRTHTEDALDPSQQPEYHKKLIQYLASVLPLPSTDCLKRDLSVLLQAQRHASRTVLQIQLSVK